MENIKPKNSKITISKLGEENIFVSGNKNWRVDWAEINGVRFEVGDTVKWIDEEAQMSYKRQKSVFKGKIEWIIIIDNGNVEIAADMPLGRLPIDEVEMIKKARKIKV